MVLGIDVLLRLVKENNLVEHLSEHELSNPEGTGFDLRIGELYKQTGPGYLGILERETSAVELIARHREGESTKVVIPAGSYYLVGTNLFNEPVKG